MLAQFHKVGAAGNFLPHIFVGVEIIAALVNKAQTDGFADFNFTRIGYFLTGDKAEQSRFTRTVWTNDAHNAALRNGEGQIFEEQFITISLGDIFDLNNLAAQTLRDLNDDLRFTRGAVFLRLDQLVKGFDTRFRFGLPRLWTLPDPFKLVLNRLLTAGVFTRFLLQTLRLLFEIGRIIAFIDKVTTAIELKDPADDIIQEIAIVGHENDVALIIDQMLFQPRNGLCVQVVSRFVEQQYVWLFQQKPRQRDTALFTARKAGDRAVAGGAT